MDFSDVDVSLETSYAQSCDISVSPEGKKPPAPQAHELSDTETRIFKIIKLLDR